MGNSICSDPAVKDPTLPVATEIQVSDKIEVSLERQPGQPLGLDLDFLDGKTARVVEVQAEGAVPACNVGRADWESVKAGDHVISVNGVRGDHAQFRRILAKENKLHLVLQRPVEFSVSVTKGSGLGIDMMNAAQGSNLMINSVKGKGAIHDWNSLAENAAVAIKIFDRIVEVNGVRGDWETLLATMKESEELTLVISPAPIPKKQQAIVSEITTDEFPTTETIEPASPEAITNEVATTSVTEEN